MMSKEKGISISKSCLILNYNRSTFYRKLLTEKKRKIASEALLGKVRSIKTLMPNIGGRKLHYMLNENVKEDERIGRDRLFALMGKYDLLVKRKRSWTVTTNSNHPFKKYKNLLQATEVRRINQVWVGDITYLKTRQGYCYLSLVTDLYSRKIMGYNVNCTLEMLGAYSALEMALKQATPEMHHSDRGCQYCSYKYTGLLKKHDVKISMTQDGNCYDNAVAERINGILKHEFNLNETFNNLEAARKTVKQSIEIYNRIRPHWSINLNTPDAFYESVA